MFRDAVSSYLSHFTFVPYDLGVVVLIKLENIWSLSSLPQTILSWLLRPSTKVTKPAFSGSQHGTFCDGIYLFTVQGRQIPWPWGEVSGVHLCAALNLGTALSPRAQPRLLRPSQGLLKPTVWIKQHSVACVSTSHHAPGSCPPAIVISSSRMLGPPPVTWSQLVTQGPLFLQPPTHPLCTKAGLSSSSCCTGASSGLRPRGDGVL